MYIIELLWFRTEETLTEQYNETVGNAIKLTLLSSNINATDQKAGQNSVNTQLASSWAGRQQYWPPLNTSLLGSMENKILSQIHFL